MDADLGSCWDWNVADGVGLGCETWEGGRDWGIEAEGLVKHGVEVGKDGIDCDEVDFGFSLEECADFRDCPLKSRRIGEELIHCQYTRSVLGKAEGWPMPRHGRRNNQQRSDWAGTGFEEGSHSMWRQRGGWRWSRTRREQG